TEAADHEKRAIPHISHRIVCGGDDFVDHDWKISQCTAGLSRPRLFAGWKPALHVVSVRFAIVAAAVVPVVAAAQVAAVVFPVATAAIVPAASVAVVPAAVAAAIPVELLAIATPKSESITNAFPH